MSGALSRLLALLPPALGRAILRGGEGVANFEGRLSEIRLRAGRAASLTVGGENLVLPVSVTREELASLVKGFCRGSIYAYSESLAEGYIDMGEGIRCGLGGRALLEGGRVSGITDITSLCLRLPHTVAGAGALAQAVFERLGRAEGLLIYSRPGVGKTTLLRDLSLRLSGGERPLRTAVIDSRGELGGGMQGEGGLLDLLCGYPKAVGIELAVRTLSPEVLICDEIGGLEEADAILAAQVSGVPLIASAHGATLAEMRARPMLRRLDEAGIFGAYLGLWREGGEVRACVHRREGTQFLPMEELS